MRRRVLRNSRSRAGGLGGGSAAALDSRIPTKWWRRWLWYLNPRRFRDFWRTKAGRRTLLKIAAMWALIGVAFLTGLFLYFAKDLPGKDQINSKLLAETTSFYDRTGKRLLYQVHGDQNRTVVKLPDISEHMRNATVAIEDKNFYKHGAFSIAGIGRAFSGVLFRDPSKGGGSTITQQYVKNALLSPERTIARKIKELILSIQIESVYAKDDILQLYLNEIPYGAQAYGVQAAAKTYFDKDAKDLTADEAALLAALPRAPTYYSPYGNRLKELFARQDFILDLMHEQGYLDDAAWKKAKKTNTYAKVNDVPNLYANIIAPHFVLHAQDVLVQGYGERQVNEGGLKVITTLDYNLQKKAEKAVRDGIGTVTAAGGNNAALVAGDPNTGQILAMVGSRNFNQPGYGAFNAATALRQPGSSFKPYVYAAGFKTNDWGPGSIMYDVPTDFGGGYRPNNYDNAFHGAHPIRWFLGNSFNIPAVKMLYVVGMQKALDQVHDMGITTLNNPEDYGLSLVLGAGEVKLTDHVNAFQSFANGGLHYAQNPILKVMNQEGETIEDNSHPEGKRVLDPQVAYLVNNILSDPGARSITFSADDRYMSIPGQTNFVKTGTTDDNRDGWMIGGTQHLIGGVWVGRSDNGPMFGITSTMTGAIWGPFMQSAHRGKANKPWTRPAGIKSVTLDANTGHLASATTRSRVTDIFPSWYKPKPASSTQEAVIDKVSNKLATDCTPALARRKITGIGIEAEIPESDPAWPRWNPPVQALAGRLGFGGGGVIPKEKDDVHNCNDDKPSVELSAKDDGEKITIRATAVKGTHALDQITISYKGKSLKTCSVRRSGDVCGATYRPSGNGTYTFSARILDKALYEEVRTVSRSFSASGGGDSFPYNYPYQASPATSYASRYRQATTG